MKTYRSVRSARAATAIRTTCGVYAATSITTSNLRPSRTAKSPGSQRFPIIVSQSGNSRGSEAAAISAQNGRALSRLSGELIGSSGSSLADVQSGLAFVAQEGQTTDKLNQMYGGSLTTDDLVAEVFTDDAKAAAKRRGLASRERATFAGSGAQTKTTLGKDTGRI